MIESCVTERICGVAEQVRVVVQSGCRGGIIGFEQLESCLLTAVSRG